MSIKEKMRQRPAHPAIIEEEVQKEPRMKWHKFLIYFALFAAAMWNVFIGVLHLTGMWYWLNSFSGNAVMVPERMYFDYPPLRVADAILYITLFLMAVYQIVIRFMLARGKKHAPLHLNVMIGIMCTVSALYDFLFEAFVRNEVYVRASLNYGSSSITLGTAFVIGTGLCIANWYYYKKRRGLSAKQV